MEGNRLLKEVEDWLDRLYIAAEGAGLRAEDRRKAVEVAAILVEIESAVRRIAAGAPLLLVDAAAGKSYVGLLAAKLILEPLGRRALIITIEREDRRVAQSRLAADRLQTSVPIECRAGAVEDPACWPSRPSIVAALHACGPATDAILDRAVGCETRNLLVVPCCTGNSVDAAKRAELKAGRLAFPHHAPVRRRFIQAAVDAERTWRLEAAGYETEVVEFVAPTTTPHNLLWRARRVCEPKRMEAARKALDVFQEP
jgi:hypothetical protein